MNSIGEPELDLLAKLEEQNRVILTDVKAVPYLSNQIRKNSACSSQSTSSYADEGYDHDLRKSSGEYSDCHNLSDTMVAADALSKEWSAAVANWGYFMKKRSYIPDLIRKGLPQKYRRVVWLLYSKAYNSSVKNLYDGYLDVVSPSEKAIRRDIPRTFPSHDLFKIENGYGQSCLYRVIKAYSNHDREVGYCQGSGFIAGLLLMQLPEIDAFALFVHLMTDYHLREMYKPNMLQLSVYMYQLEQLIADHLPELKEHFTLYAFVPTLYASAWFLTLFTRILSVPVATRVMDLFLVDGINFVFRMSLAILKFSSDALLSADMESMIVFLQDEGPQLWNQNASVIFEMAASYKLSQRKMDKLKKEYITLRCQDREDQIELRRLRTENGLLLQRITHIEEECQTLAERLIQSQLIRAEDSELLLTLRCELSSLKEANANGGPAAAAVTPTSTTNSSTCEDQARENERFECNGAVVPTPNREVVAVLADWSEPNSVFLKTLWNSGFGRPRKSETTSGDYHPTESCLDAGGAMDEAIVSRIHRLQTDLTICRHREAEATAELIDLRHRCQQLEEDLARQRYDSCEQVNTLRSELLTVKLRETEALSRLEYLKKQVDEVYAMWQTHTQHCKLPETFASSSLSSSSTSTTKMSPLTRLQNTFKGVGGDAAGASPGGRLPDRLVELNVTKRVTSLQNEITELNLQQEISDQKIGRLNEHISSLLEQQALATRREDQLRKELKAKTRMCAEIESWRNSDGLMWRSRELTLRSKLTQYRQAQAELEHKYYSLLTTQCLQQTDPGSPGSPTTDAAPTEGQEEEGESLQQEQERLLGNGGHSPNRGSGAETPKRRDPTSTNDVWRDLPACVMTDSIGPLEELRLVLEPASEERRSN